MADTLAELRDYVRTHMDLDSDELPNVLLDTWAREATTRVWKAKTTWTFFEREWTLDTEADRADYEFDEIDPDVDSVTAVYGDQRRLQWRDRDDMERSFLPNTGSGQPVFFSTWGEKLRFHPTPSSVETLQIRGYVKPSDWTRVANGAGEVPFPDEFSNTVRLWMVGAAYLQQEDTELGITYADMFNDELEKLKKRFGVAPPSQPLVIGGGRRYTSPMGRFLYPWD